MTKQEIVDLVENKLGFTNGWRVSDEQYKEICEEIAETILTETKKEALHLPDVSECSEQWHVLSANMGDGKCSKCGKKLTELNFR